MYNQLLCDSLRSPDLGGVPHSVNTTRSKIDKYTFLQAQASESHGKKLSDFSTMEVDQFLS